MARIGPGAGAEFMVGEGVRLIMRVREPDQSVTHRPEALPRRGNEAEVRGEALDARGVLLRRRRASFLRHTVLIPILAGDPLLPKEPVQGVGSGGEAPLRPKVGPEPHDEDAVSVLRDPVLGGVQKPVNYAIE